MTCERCRWWKPIKPAQPAKGKAVAPTQGECHGHIQPVVVVSTGEVRWGVTAKDETCVGYTPKQAPVTR